MTIASEISRLQTDKECIRQAIIWKWVSVASSVSLDNYASCIDAIEQGWWCIIEALVVWWGWAGNKVNECKWGWWGWWGVARNYLTITNWTASVVVWSWWTTKGAAWTTSCVTSGTNKIWARWWFWWNNNWWTSWWWNKNNTSTVCASYAWWTWYWDWTYPRWWGWWWGWAWWVWCPSCTAVGTWWDGWPWLYWYGWWWGWGSGCSWWWKYWIWIDWWGCWETQCWARHNKCNATNYWWWGGWWYGVFWVWCQWVVDICYPSDWSFWFTCATWWTKTLIDNTICRHRFTSNWTFTIVS